jgi:hypothetical protein
VALLNDSEVLDPGSAQRVSEGVMDPNKSCAAEEHALGQKDGKRFLLSWRAPANPDLAIVLPRPPICAASIALFFSLFSLPSVPTSIISQNL